MRTAAEYPVAGSHKGRVLIVEDQTGLARMAVSALQQAGFACETFEGVDDALKSLEHRGAEAMVVDLNVAGLNGADVVEKIHKKDPEMPVIVATSPASPVGAAEAVKRGAFDFVAKPFVAEELVTAVSRASEMTALQRENQKLRERLDVATRAAGFVAASSQSKELVAMIRRVAPARSTVLIQGESGTGKELIARMLHYWSKRAEGPFVAINCKAFADGVVESELFGHERGSFTGAIASRAGCFERASGGTLFLDEIAEAGADFQAKLLRVLEDGEVLRVGGSKPRKVDVRIVTATNRALRREVEDRRFRADLYFRLNVIPIHIPPLRERRDDILPLAHHFLAFHEADTARPLSLSREAEEALLGYAWPGNVRELENVIERAVVMSGSEVITPDALALEGVVEPERTTFAGSPGVIEEDRSGTPNGVQPAAGAGTLQEWLDRAATERIKAALQAAGGNRVEAAGQLGVDRTTLYRLMKRLGL
jgi:DNA-binding NtrC family response regulator